MTETSIYCLGMREVSTAIGGAGQLSGQGGSERNRPCHSSRKTPRKQGMTGWKLGEILLSKAYKRITDQGVTDIYGPTI